MANLTMTVNVNASSSLTTGSPEETFFPSGEEPDALVKNVALPLPYSQSVRHGFSCEDWPLHRRQAWLKRINHLLATRTEILLADLHTAPFDASDNEHLVTQVIPLAEAIAFLSANLPRFLRPKHVGRYGRPAWLAGVSSTLERRPHGLILVLAASNFPLYLAGVQTVQALAAGNRVLLKPAPGAEQVLKRLQDWMYEAGLPAGALTLLDSNPAAGEHAIEQGVDLVVLTGSQATGKKVMHGCAEHLTPLIAELSGCDAVVVAPGANLDRAARCIAYGLSLNGGAACCSPRRLFVHNALLPEFESKLAPLLSKSRAIVREPKLLAQWSEIAADCQQKGAIPLGKGLQEDGALFPQVWKNAHPDLLLFRSDAFLPVAGIASFTSLEEARELLHDCPYHLGASLFGPEAQMRSWAASLRVGNVLVNDLIVPSADPRLPFPAWGGSGFGVTRGEEGLLAMTRIQCITRRSGDWLPHILPQPVQAGELFRGYLLYAFASAWRTRWWGLLRLIRAALGPTVKEAP